MPKRKLKEAHGYVDEWKSMWEPDLEAIAYNGATCDPTKVDPKVLQWVREHCDAHQPRFVKVLCASAAHGWHGNRKSQHQIFVPRPFVREHYRELGRVVTLESGVSQHKWKVSFGSPTLSSSWLQGWRRVAVENRLRPGDVMVFVLVAHSHFRFHLFDENGNAAPETWNRKATAKVECFDEDQVHVKKMPRLFDPDLPVVKTEPAFFQRSVSPEGHAPIAEPPQPEDWPRLVLRTSPDSELTVTDGEAETRVKNAKSRKSAKLNTRHEVPQITDELGDEVFGVVDGFVKRRLGFEAVTRDVEAGKGSGLVAGKVLQVPPNFNPLEYLVQSKRRTTTPTERKRAIGMARAYVNSLVECEGFVVSMSEAKLYKDFHLPLPEEFVIDTSFPSTLTKVRLVDWDGGSSSSNINKKTWEVYSERNSSNEPVSFHGKHWGVFALEHFLEPGDVCVFQLKDAQNFTISVRIFRVLDLVDQQPHGCSVWDHYEIRPKPVIKSSA